MFAGEHGVVTPLVEVELSDDARFTIERIAPEPGFGKIVRSPEVLHRP